MRHRLGHASLLLLVPVLCVQMSCLSSRTGMEDGEAKSCPDGPPEAIPQTAVFGMVLDHMATTGPLEPKVLVVGIDGARPDSLAPAGLAKLIAGKMPGARYLPSYAGGDPEGRRQATLTAPGFSSILTGRWASGHGVWGNLDVDKDPSVPSFPALVVAGWPGKRAAVLAAWEAIVLGSTYGDEGIYRFFPGQGYYTGDYAAKDPAVIAESRRCIEDGYDLVFTVLDLVDHAGHESGFSPGNPCYVEAMKMALAMVEELLDAIRARPGYAGEDWLVILTTDHGGKGRSHGAQSPEERATFILSWDSGGG